MRSENPRPVLSSGEVSEIIKVLLVEDNPGDARLIREMLKEAGAAQFEVAHVERLDEALKRLGEEAFDVMLLDLNLLDSQGLIRSPGRTLRYQRCLSWCSPVSRMRYLVSIRSREGRRIIWSKGKWTVIC